MNCSGQWSRSPGISLRITTMAPTEVTKKKILLLLDMNGSMCYRTETPLRNVKHSLYLRSRYFYARGGLKDFLRALDSTKNFHICVYTSMMEHNASGGLAALLGDKVSLIKKVFHRDYNKPDPKGENHWDTIRDMKKIYKYLDGFDEKNTILVDNEARKLRETPRNGIIVDEMSAEDARTAEKRPLLALQEYLEKLAKDSPTDVREYMKKHPFTGVCSEDAGNTKLENVIEDLQSLSVEADTKKATTPKSLKELPAGSTVHLKCIDGLWAVMKFAGEKRIDFKVKLQEGVRIETKMDVHRLIRNAKLDNILMIEDDDNISSQEK